MRKKILTSISLIIIFQSNGQAKEDLDSVQEHFKKRCTAAGETIKRTIRDVDGVLLLKLRSRRINFGDQFVLDDPYGSDFQGDGYIRSFLHAHHEITGHYDRVRGRSPSPQKNFGYDYVEAVDPQDGKRYRYTANVEQPGLDNPAYSKDYFRINLKRVPASAQAPRYGVTYDDISTTEDRRYWIAGSSLKVIDLRTGEVIAERIGYMFDPGLGNVSGGRSPWLMAAAHACPAFGGRHPAQSQGGQTIRFVEKVLLPRRQAQHGR